MSPVHQDSTVFRPIAPFVSEPQRHFFIRYPVAYQIRLRKESGVRVTPNASRGYWNREFELDHLEVNVCFRRRITTRVQTALAATVAAWARDAQDCGAFDDGPISLLPSGIEFGANRARFSIDARRSGQDTLNWLSLVLFDFAMDVHAMTDISFGEGVESLDEGFGPIITPSIVAFPGLQIDGPPPIYTDNSATRIPAESRPAEDLRSECFPILVLPYDQWESFVATIYLGQGHRTMKC